MPDSARPTSSSWSDPTPWWSGSNRPRGPVPWRSTPPASAVPRKGKQASRKLNPRFLAAEQPASSRPRSGRARRAAPVERELSPATSATRMRWTTGWSPAQVRADAWLPMESDALGDDPARLARHKLPVMGTAPLPRTPSCEKLTALRAVARQVAERGRGRPRGFRTETGLAPKDHDRWYRAVGRRPQDRAAAARVGLTAATGRTPDLLQAGRRTSVRTNQNRPANRAFSLEWQTVGPRRVRSQSDPTQTNKPTAHAKRACKYRPF